MADPSTYQSCPFTFDIFCYDASLTDLLPAAYHYSEWLEKKRTRRKLADPSKDIRQFLNHELSLGSLTEMLNHLWFAGSRRPATQLHMQLAMGREIAVADRMNLHLLWDDSPKIFIKPLPAFLLSLKFWKTHLTCPNGCACARKEPAMGKADSQCNENLRKVALGFLYTYACLICSESDFFAANERRLLPRGMDDSTIPWSEWKTLVRQLVESHEPANIHPRFLRAELRLSRINTINRFTRLPLFDPYHRSWRNYGSLFRDNLTWMATATVFIAVILTALQVGLATDQLRINVHFQRASYGFAVFSILGPICALAVVTLAALFNLIKDVPWLLTNHRISYGASRDPNTGMV